MSRRPHRRKATLVISVRAEHDEANINELSWSGITWGTWHWHYDPIALLAAFDEKPTALFQACIQVWYH